jgi:tRNA threonylcarbamoyladenosine biosynthesis protein TsaB
MRVLAIDTALASCSAAIFDTEHGHIVASDSEPMVRGHAEALMPLVQRVMDAAHLAFPAIDRVAVTTGPGSFTGLRVGVAAARGIALAAGKPVVGVTTLSAYAAPHMAADDSIPVVAVIDARHSHVYLQHFSPGGRTLTAPRFAALHEAARVAGQKPACIVGSAAQAVADAMSPSDSRPLIVDARGAPDIAWVARMGAVVPESEVPPAPLYLRAADAQPQYAMQLPRR